MNAINFGIQWDAEPDVDAALKVEQERAAQSSHGENGKNLPPPKSAMRPSQQLHKPLKKTILKKLKNCWTPTQN